MAEGVPRRTAGVESRRMVVIGGGERRASDGTGILERFVNLSGGPRARIVVITTASGEPRRVESEYLQVFDALGVEHVCALRLEDRVQANSAHARGVLTAATGVFFAGGDQFRIAAVLGGTRVDSLLHARVRDGLVLAGTSAGAAMMSSTMVLGGEGVGVNSDSVRTGPGMEFLPHLLIDMHFAERGRLTRLLSAVANFPHELGVGIDEDTALVVEGERFEVIGSGSVTMVDAGPASHVEVLAGPHGPIGIVGARLHVLPAGYAFELNDREPCIVRTGDGGAP
ncbi:cyanophycinase [Micromonospora purpureochromogenes]|uniref:Cyanophycinase n=2 Tax=Micromonospora purpureochromogenes TaxID=47872 RepID=A0A1C4XS07_9ACTN|nr:cyanophycinase [Micromonospora purpureochromogenes]